LRRRSTCVSAYVPFVLRTSTTAAYVDLRTFTRARYARLCVTFAHSCNVTERHRAALRRNGCASETPCATQARARTPRTTSYSLFLPPLSFFLSFFLSLSLSLLSSKFFFVFRSRAAQLPLRLPRDSQTGRGPRTVRRFCASPAKSRPPLTTPIVPRSPSQPISSLCLCSLLFSTRDKSANALALSRRRSVRRSVVLGISSRGALGELRQTSAPT